MANAYRDENRVPTLIGVSSVDNQTPIRVEVNPTTNAMFVELQNSSGDSLGFTSLTGPSEPTVDSYTHVSINLSAGANQILVSSAPSKQIWVYGIGFTVNAAGTVSIQDEDDTAITGIMNFAANSGMIVNPSGNFSMPIWKLGTDKDLEIDIVTSELDGWVDYAIISV